MCGFVGAVFTRPVQVSDVEAVRAATRTIVHRGPDADGVIAIEDCRAVLGFRRLSIIDLATGDQPMSHGGAHHLVFNGEIYNYREVRPGLEKDGAVFRTHSDTEVLLQSLARRGVDGLEPLRGMFGFAYVDGPRRRLVLGRDRLGVKQHYYAETAEGVFFASEPKALLALPWVRAAFNADVLPRYLNFRSVPAPDTLFKGIHKLPPGAVREYALDDLGRGGSERRYWTYPAAAAPQDRIPMAESVDAMERILTTAIERRLVSDVPVGAFLSGGLDSSLVVAGIQRLGRTDVKTFSATFPGSPDDEGPLSSAVARQFGLVNHPVPLVADDFLEVVPRWFSLIDDLVADASSLPLMRVADRGRAEGVIVMLAGEGADELFGGYGVYHRFGQMRRAAALVPTRALRRQALDLALRVGLLGRENEPRAREYFVERRDFLGQAALLDMAGLAEFLPNVRAELPRAASGRLEDLGAFDFARRIPDDLLVRTDRATMGASIEARVPFLDHDLVELVQRLAPEARAVPGTSKVVLRSLAARWGVPDSTIRHRKIGFKVPIGAWFRGPLRGVWDDILSRRAIPGLSYDAVARRVRAHVAREASYDELLWRLLSLEAWYARWIDGRDLQWPSVPGRGNGLPPHLASA